MEIKHIAKTTANVRIKIGDHVLEIPPGGKVTYKGNGRVVFFDGSNDVEIEDPGEGELQPTVREELLEHGEKSGETERGVEEVNSKPLKLSLKEIQRELEKFGFKFYGYQYPLKPEGGKEQQLFMVREDPPYLTQIHVPVGKEKMARIKGLLRIPEHLADKEEKSVEFLWGYWSVTKDFQHSLETPEELEYVLLDCLSLEKLLEG